MFKEIWKTAFRSKVNAAVLFLLALFTSFMFFFVRFSSDGNIGSLIQLEQSGSLTGAQAGYLAALRSNQLLAGNFLLVLLAFSAFAYLVFFFRLSVSHQKELGLYRSLGIPSRRIAMAYGVTALLPAAPGVLTGLVTGWLCSDILLQANRVTYGISGNVKGISGTSISLGTVLVLGVLTLCSCGSCLSFWHKEPALLTHGGLANNRKGFNLWSKAAAWGCEKLPLKNKTGLRLALRRPLSLLVFLIAVVLFSVMLFIGISLNQSSGIVFSSQVEGRNYNFDTVYPEFQTSPAEGAAYLRLPVKVTLPNGASVTQNILGIDDGNLAYVPLDQNGNAAELPATGLLAGPWLAELYGIKKGDILAIEWETQSVALEVQGIAQNAESGCLLMNRTTLSASFGLPDDTCNGIWSTQPLPGHDSVSAEQRRDELRQASVSNQVSAVINQVIGGVSGCLLIVLALSLHLQDSARDILILRMLGKKSRDINRLLLDVYRPILYGAYVLFLPVSISIARQVQKGLSIQTTDYMPFFLPVTALLMALVSLAALYELISAVYRWRISRMLLTETFLEELH